MSEPKRGDRVRVTFEATYRSSFANDGIYLEIGSGTYYVPKDGLALEVLSPPKPPEPTGLGAVVEDTEAERWVRVNAEGRPWRRDGSTFAPFESIDVARVLSEGVTA